MIGTFMRLFCKLLSLFVVLNAFCALGAQNDAAFRPHVSLSGKVGWDSNLFGYHDGVPAGYESTADRSSLMLSAEGTIKGDFAKLLGLGEALQKLELGYVGQYSWYVDAASEDYASHRLPLLVRIKTDRWDVSLENRFLFVDGSRDGPIYNLAEVSAFGLVYARERRMQIQDHGSFKAEYLMGKWFVRPVAMWSSYDLHTHQKQEVGYQNFIDRSDVNGGADIGYDLGPMRAFAGYRYGYQYQQALPWVGLSSTNDYQRAIFGAQMGDEEWKLSAQLGPSFHSYTANRLIGAEKDICRLYAEIAASLALDEKQEIDISYHQSEGLSSTSGASYAYYALGGGYRARLTDKIRFSGRVDWVFADYEPPTVRRDGMLSPSLSLAWKCTDYLELRLDYVCNIGYNDLSNVPGRDFTRHCLMFGITANY